MKRAMLALVCGLWAASLGVAQPAWATEALPTRPMSLDRLKFALKEGETWIHVRFIFAICPLLDEPLPTWRAGTQQFESPRFAAIFDEELTRAGLATASPDNMFERTAPSGHLLVGATIEDMHAEVCDYSVTGRYRGSMTMTVSWQVFDPTRREIIARSTVVSQYEQKKSVPGALELLIIDGFRQNAAALLAKPEFRQAVQSPQEPAEKAPKPTDRTTLLVALAKDAKTPIHEAVGSVVTVFNGDGHGSGFLISADGYLMTARHVVGDSKLVRIRWSDGFETEGEVLRSDKRRDVALIKSNPHSRAPLVLRGNRLNPGDTVFAIGAPLDEKYQGTVSRGVVSAYRIDEGLNVLQSDVSVTFGNSGGPLLDDRGAVVGIADAVYRPNGRDIPTGISFFVPIGDALDFLAIKATP